MSSSLIIFSGLAILIAVVIAVYILSKWEVFKTRDKIKISEEIANLPEDITSLLLKANELSPRCPVGSEEEKVICDIQDTLISLNLPAIRKSTDLGYVSEHDFNNFQETRELLEEIDLALRAVEDNLDRGFKDE
ncbi:MAG: hypothetical protein E6R13_02300 [Spirochaetes bacterium]|nr:MAG: hypothetical protein E6R13_02300 [Spirochaetota bacterium]